MKNVIILLSFSVFSQEWIVTATNINPANYYGVTVANGMTGIVSSLTKYSFVILLRTPKKVL